MTIFQHLVPQNVFGLSSALKSSTTGSFIVDDVGSSIYAQTSSSPVPATKVGYTPCVADGVGGLVQLARDLNARFYSQAVTTGFSTSLVGTSLTVNYPSIDVLWNGVKQTLAAGSITGTVSTGLWSLVVGYNWGLDQVQLLSTSGGLDPVGNYAELIELNVNTTSGSVTVSSGKINLKFFETIGVGSNGGLPFSSNPSLIPVSDGSGTMPW